MSTADTSGLLLTAVEIYAEDQMTMALLDSAASNNFASSRFLPIHTTIEPAAQRAARLASQNARMEIADECELTFFVAGIRFSSQFFVARDLRLPPYRFTAEKKEAMQDQIEEMLANGIIEAASSPYSSPVVLVMIKDGKYRFCVDFGV